MVRIECVVDSVAGTGRLAAKIAATLAQGDTVALHGELGAGKTAFVRGLAAAMGADPAEVSSPTFVVVQEYACSGGRRLVHADAYRMQDADEFEAAGWDEAIGGACVAVIEWASHVIEAMPASALQITIQRAGDSPRTRRVTIDGDEAVWGAKLRGVARTVAKEHGGAG